MRLSDLPRTSSFQLSALFLALFGLSSLLLFAFLYTETDRFLTGSVDRRLLREAQADLAQPETIVARLQGHIQRDPENMRPFGLFDGGGRVVMGQIPHLPRQPVPLRQPFDFTLPQGGRSLSYRGAVYPMPSGQLLLLSENIEELHGVQAELLHVMGWGGLLMLLVGLGGALLAARASERRISDITRAIERIVRGDLAERLPTGARSGDLDRLAHLVNGMLDDIERLMREVKGVTDDIAHNMRTPLTRLLASLERVRRRGGAKQHYEQAVDEAIEEMQALLGTFGGLLRIAEVEDGARRAGFACVELGKIAGDAAELHAPVAEERGITLSCEPSRSGVEMLGDPNLLFEAVSNLVDNAIKFTPSGGHVNVRTFRCAGRVGVMVEDDGPGIPEEERDAVLRRLYRLEKSRHAPGSGLGLSLVAAVARLHGLSVTISSACPGCRVTLTCEESLQPPSARPAVQIPDAHAAMAS
jgi:signal transduction histidine kinase